MEPILLYIVTGIISGILAGLLGIGGGLIIVPALVFILSDSSEYVMHTAVGTSLSIVMLTALSSTRAHYKKGTINGFYWRLLTPGLFMGTLAGAFLADQLRGETLRYFFALFELLVAIQLSLDLKAKPGHRKPGAFSVFCISLPIGLVSALAGIGGGTMVVPFLSWTRLTIQEAVSTSAACGIPIAIAGTIGFMVIGLDVDSKLASASTGFVYWPAFLSISIPSVLFAPLGAKLAHALPPQVLRRIFALFLLMLAIFMFLG